MHDPVGISARTELDRLAHRWHTLPVGQARSAAVPARSLAGEFLGTEVEDLGPAAALDQLRVAVYEAARAGTPDEVAGDRLADLRRRINAGEGQ